MMFFRTGVSECAEPTIITKISSKTTWTLKQLVNTRQTPGRRPRVTGGRLTPKAVQTDEPDSRPAGDASRTPFGFDFDFDDDFDLDDDCCDAFGLPREDIETTYH
jgi:hypothetical protein